MKYYASIQSNSLVGRWEILKAQTLTGAKREATKKLGCGYIGDIICVVEANDLDMINDKSAHKKVIGVKSKWYFEQ